MGTLIVPYMDMDWWIDCHFCTVARVKFIYYHMKGNEVHQAGCIFEEYKILEICSKMLRIPEIHFDYCAIFGSC